MLGGYEPCTIKSIKEYKPTTKSISSGQVLHCPYNYKQTKIIIKEMADLIALDLVDKGVMTDQLVLTIGYDIENLTKSNINYSGEVTLDQYGRKIPKHSHGTIKIEHKTSSSSLIMNKLLELYERIVNKDLLIRRINISANRIESESNCIKKPTMKQFNLFSSLEEQEKEYEQEYEKEKNDIQIQRVMLNIKSRFGKNAILRGINLEKDGTTIDRNKQIGGHHE